MPLDKAVPKGQRDFQVPHNKQGLLPLSEHLPRNPHCFLPQMIIAHQITFLRFEKSHVIRGFHKVGMKHRGAVSEMRPFSKERRIVLSGQPTYCETEVPGLLSKTASNLTLVLTQKVTWSSWRESSEGRAYASHLQGQEFELQLGRALVVSDHPCEQQAALGHFVKACFLALSS